MVYFIFPGIKRKRKNKRKKNGSREIFKNNTNIAIWK